jgi:PKD repeat protein
MDMRKSVVLLAAVCLTVALSGMALATEYHVGPGQPYATMNDLLIAVTLGDNDIAWIHPGTYPAFWVRAGGGSTQAAAAQIRAWDISDKPVIDAAGAANAVQFEDPSGAFTLVGKWFLIDGLEVKNASSRGIFYVSTNLVMRHCYIHDCHNGIMGGYHNNRTAALGFSPSEEGNLIAEYNEFYRDGSGTFAHPCYLQSNHTEFRYNWIHEPTGGSSYKDRSTDSVLEYNYIEQGDAGANYTIEFCGFDDNNMPDIPQYATMIGNVVVKNDGGNAWLFVANERAEGNPNRYQNIGYLLMVNNTLYSINHTGPMLAGDDGSIITAHNNVFQSTTCNRILDKVNLAKTPGAVLTSYNNWVNSRMTVPAAFTGTVFGTDPGCVNATWPLGDFHLAAGSQCTNAGRNDVGDLPVKEYAHPLSWVARSSDGAVDIGAYEYAGGGGLPPVASFTANPTSGIAPLTVYFTDTSTNAPTSWSWTFGDGGTSPAQHPSHQYQNAGSYTVSLTATNAYGSDTNTRSNYITVTGGGAQDYTCASATVNTGTVQSGDHTSVHVSDDVYLVVRSAKSAGRQTAQVSYTFTTGLGSLSSLSVTVEGKVSAGSQPVTVYAYNYTTAAWTSVATGTLTTTDSTLTPSVASPASYLSGGAIQIRVKAGGSGSSVFDHSTDLVKITAAP